MYNVFGSRILLIMWNVSENYSLFVRTFLVWYARAKIIRIAKWAKFIGNTKHSSSVCTLDCWCWHKWSMHWKIDDEIYWDITQYFSWWGWMFCTKWKTKMSHTKLCSLQKTVFSSPLHLTFSSLLFFIFCIYFDYNDPITIWDYL